MLQLALDAIFARDDQRRITFWNRGAERMLGFTREEALGRQPAELLHTRYPIPLDEIEAIVARTGFWEGELVQRTRDGREVVVESRWAAEYDDGGRLVGMLEVNRDITARLAAESEAERGRLQAQLARARRMESLGQLAGGVAHDFNNLLAIILNYATFVADEIEAADAGEADGRWTAARADIAQVRGAAERATSLTGRLLAFARQDDVSEDAIDLGAVVDGVRALLERALGPRVELVTPPGPAVRTVLADGGQIEQALINLAINARDAMPDGGRLTIVTADVDVGPADPELEPGRYVELVVADTGIGMEPEVLEHAAEPFFTTKAHGDGTGLGLATVFGAAVQAGGTMRISSRPGTGTTVRLLLPAVEQAPPAPAAPPDGRTTGSETVLLVEDEHALREAARRILARAGYRVLTARDGRAALARARDHEGAIDLLLADVVMPGMLGPELAGRLVAERPGMRVVFMSGFDRGALGADVAAAVHDVIDKPFTPGVLLRRVRGALDAA